jgi:hypothetical protein
VGTTKVTVPSGCTGLDMADGTRYNAPKQGTSIEVDDRHAAAVKRSWYGGTGVISTNGLAVALGTKKGRRCGPCGRIWNAWSDSCPKCGRPTEPEPGPS